MLFKLKRSGRLGETCFKIGDYMAKFEIRRPGRLGVERLSLVSRQETAKLTFSMKGSGRLGEPCFNAKDHTQN